MQKKVWYYEKWVKRHASFPPNDLLTEITTSIKCNAFTMTLEKSETTRKSLFTIHTIQTLELLEKSEATKKPSLIHTFFSYISSSDADSSMTSSTTTDDRNNSIDRNRNITLESNANFAVKQLTTFNNNLNNQLLTEHANGFKLFKKPPRAPNSTPIHRPKPKTEQDEVIIDYYL